MARELRAAFPMGESTCKSAENFINGVQPECPRLAHILNLAPSFCERDAFLGPIADIVILLMLCNAVQLLFLPATPPGGLSSSSRTLFQDLLAPTHFSRTLQRAARLDCNSRAWMVLLREAP